MLENLQRKFQYTAKKAAETSMYVLRTPPAGRKLNGGFFYENLH